MALRLDLAQALDKLPPELGQIFRLAALNQWPLRDVANFLDLPLGTVK